MIPDFEDGVLAVRRDANALATVALVLGASDVDSTRKASASALVAAAQKLESAKSVAEVKSAYASLVKARAAQDGVRREWEKVATLKPLMKYALPSLSTEIKRLARNEKTFLRKANTKKVINASTTMVAIALGARENVDETLAPDEDEVWRDYCERLANAALEFNEHATAVAAGKGSFDDMKAAHKAVEETCSSTCHEKFGGQTAE